MSNFNKKKSKLVGKKQPIAAVISSASTHESDAAAAAAEQEVQGLPAALAPPDDVTTAGTADPSSDEVHTVSSVVAKEDPDVHPLRCGHSIVVRYRDNSERLSKILERSFDKSSGSWLYYIHYYQFNRRMDEWISADRILQLPSIANTVASACVDDHGTYIGDNMTSSSALLATGSSAEPSGADARQSEAGAGDGGASGSSKKRSALSTVAELEHDEHEGMDEAALREHEEVTKIKNIRNVLLGKHKIECWYFSPYPKEFYPDGPVECLYVCEFSFRFFRTQPELMRYLSKPQLLRHPPGNEIYRDSSVSMFEVDGAVEKAYCQNLSYFAKLFLDHKTLYFDVDPFLFYVLCSRDDRGYHPVGYFSKEKYSDMGYNLACILTFPHAQRKGYGRFLIAFSYELSKKEEKVGSPEKPLSDLGGISYRSYWASTLLSVLRTFPSDRISVLDLAKLTSITTDDVLSTLQFLGLIRNVGGSHVIYAPPESLDALMVKYPVAAGLLVDPDKLVWAPLYVCDYRKDKWSIRAKSDSVDDDAGVSGVGL